MPFLCWKKRNEKWKRLERNVSDAISVYNEAVEQEDKGKHRDAYLVYLKAQTRFYKVQEEYNDKMTKPCQKTVQKFLDQISSRLPVCAKLSQNEIVRVMKRLQELKEKEKLGRYILTTQDIITNFDKAIFMKNMSSKLKAQIPKEEEEEYTDDSELEDFPGNEDAPKIKILRGTAFQQEHLKKRVVPPSEKCRPKRPRVESLWFHRMMSKAQPWDSMKHLVNREKLNVKWTDVIGYEKVKTFLSTAFVYEVERCSKELDTHKGSCMKKQSINCLLYGPTGIGKTQLAHAVATEAGSHIFIRALSSSFLSKYVGQSEKNLTLLFQMANDLGPSIIFFDDCEGIFADRMKSDSQVMVNITTTLLSLMTTYAKVSVIATTSLPWLIDPAFICKFNARVLLDLPKKKEREVMLKYSLKTCFNSLTDKDYIELAGMTKGFSGDDITNLGLNVFHMLQNEIREAEYFKPCPLRHCKVIPTNVSDTDPSTVKASYTNLRAYDLEHPILEVETVKAAIKTMKPIIDTPMVEAFRQYHKTNEIPSKSYNKPHCSVCCENEQFQIFV